MGKRAEKYRRKWKRAAHDSAAWEAEVERRVVEVRTLQGENIGLRLALQGEAERRRVAQDESSRLKVEIEELRAGQSGKEG